MGYACSGEEKLTHSLFGGTESVVLHKKYLIRLNGLFDNNRYCVEVLNREKNCSDILKIPRGLFMSEIKKEKVYLLNLNNQVDLLYKFSSNEIHGLIGADVASKLYKYTEKKLKVELWFGINGNTSLWALMGKVV